MSRNWLARALFENWGLKTVSFLIALLLWGFVVGERHSDIHLNIPLALGNIPEDVVITSSVPNDISVRISGPRTIIATINPKQYRLTLDLKGMQQGTSSYEILPARLGFPRGVNVSDISPSVVTLVADRTVKKILPVKVRLKGLPAEGYEVANITTKPEIVEVSGAEKELKFVREIPTEIIDITGADGGVTRSVEVVFPGPSFKLKNDRPVEVKVRVRKIRSQRDFQDIPVITPKGEWTVTPPTVEVHLAGEVGVLSKISARDIIARAVPAGPPSAVGGLHTVEVVLPEGAELTSVLPAEVLLRPVK